MHTRTAYSTHMLVVRIARICLWTCTTRTAYSHTACICLCTCTHVLRTARTRAQRSFLGATCPPAHPPTHPFNHCTHRPLSVSCPCLLLHTPDAQCVLPLPATAHTGRSVCPAPACYCTHRPLSVSCPCLLLHAPAAQCLPATAFCHSLWLDLLLPAPATHSGLSLPLTVACPCHSRWPAPACPKVCPATACPCLPLPLTVALPCLPQSVPCSRLLLLPPRHPGDPDEAGQGGLPEACSCCPCTQVTLMKQVKVACLRPAPAAPAPR